MKRLAKKRLTIVAVAVATVALVTGAMMVSGASAGTTPVIVGGFRPEAPDVSGGRVVWSDNMYGSYDIFMYDAATGQTTRLTTDASDEIQPSISGDIVVFTHNGATGSDIYSFDISTSSLAIVTNASGDQINPTISGTYVAWEDRTSGYLPQIWIRNLASGGAVRIASGYSSGFKRPRAGGEWVVYEAYMSGTGGDPDVHAYNFRTAQRVTVASGDHHEMVPATDGRYVVWADRATGDMDIRAYDLQTSQTMTVRTQPGEQTFPVVAGGVVYWVDNDGDSRLHVDTYDIATKIFEPYNSLSTAEMMAVTAEGESLAWLEPATNGNWQVRAVLSGSGGGGQMIAGSILPATPAWLPFRLAQISASGDLEAPAVAETSVEPGELNVDAGVDLAVYFSEPLAVDSVDGAIQLLTEEGEPVPAAVRYSALAQAVTVDPAEPLGEGTFVLSVDGSVSDKVGNALGEDYVVAFSTIETFADTQNPTKPGGVTSRVDGLSNVELSWRASSDDSGIAAYHIYRYWEPIETANLGSATLVVSAPGNVTSYSVPAKASSVTERDAKYTYYYALIAEDTVGKLSALSSNTAPDPHGTYVFGKNTNNCSTCHGTHGGAPQGWWALGAKNAEACYACHGNTAMATAYGHGSTFNTQARFWDYSSDPLPSGGSQHRNAYMTSVREDCDACHGTHKRPYDQMTGGVKDPDTSYSKLLKSPTDPSDSGSALVYSTDTTPLAEPFCFACHGSSSGGALTYMADKGGASAFSDTAGDHNEASYDVAAVAHGTGNVYDTTRAANDPGPAANCTACHNEHASAVTRLIDYRQSNTTASTYDQSGLCFSCHASGSGESDSNGSAPFAWNGRDVNVQFAKGSTHPITAAAGGGGGPQVGNWLQTTQAQFASNTLSGVTALAGGTGISGQVQLTSLGGGNYENSGTMVSTVIAEGGGTVNGWTDLALSGDVPAGATMTFDVLDGGDDTVLDSGITLAQSPYSLAAINAATHPSLKLRANMTGNGTGGASIGDDFNDNSFDTTKWTDVYINSTDPNTVGVPVTLFSDDFESGDLSAWTSNDPQWTASNAQANNGSWSARGLNTQDNTYQTAYLTKGGLDLSGLTGSATLSWAIMWSGTEAADDFTVEWYDGSSWTSIDPGYDLDPDQAWMTDSATIPQTATQIRFRYYANYGTDYMYIDDVSLTGTELQSWPQETGGELIVRGEGSDFWGTSDEGAFVHINPSQATWIAGNDWDAIVEVPSFDNTPGNAWMKTGLMLRSGTSDANAILGGAKMAGIYLTGANGASFQYRPTTGGNAVNSGTTAAVPPRWLKLERRGNNIAGYVSTDRINWTQVGSTVPVALDPSVLVGVCLTSHVNGSFSEANFDDFLVQQTGTPSTVTPSLYEWEVDYVWTAPVLTSSLTCYNCHNTHYVEKGSGAWDMDRVSDPDNTRGKYTGTPTAFCTECHDGTLPAATISASQLIPYTVGVSDMSSYDFFPGWDKGQTGVEFSNSGHSSTAILNLAGKTGCDACHDPHASDNDRLTALTANGGPVGQNHPNATRDNSNTYAEEDLCYGCHDNSRTGTCSNGGCHANSLTFLDVSTAFSQTYAHPVTTSGRHSDIEGASDFGSANRHAECVDCHDPHAARDGSRTQGQSTAGPALRGAIGVKPSTWNGNWSTPTGWGTERISGQSTDYEAYVCFKCHSTYTTLPSGASDVALEFNPSNQSGHNVMADVWPKTSTGAPDSLPYSWSFPTSNVFKTGWSTSSMLTCSDCHTGQTGNARGPHGSSVPYILDSAYATAWTSTSASIDKDHAGGLGMPTTLICSKCHDLYDGNNWGNTVHDKHEGRGSSGGYCTHCHIGIPHGWKRPRLLGYTDDPAAYATRSNGISGIDYQSYTPTSWNKQDCGTGGCTSSMRHPTQSNRWP